MKFLLTILAVMFLASCAKEDSNDFIPYPGNQLNDTTWRNVLGTDAPAGQLFSSVFQNTVLTDSLDNAAGGRIHFNDSLDIEFPKFFVNNNSITGLIKVEVTILRNKGSWIQNGFSTMSGSKILESAGAFYIRLSKNGQEVQLSGGLNLNVILTTKIPQQGLDLFSADISNPLLVEWQPYNSSGSNVKVNSAPAGGYAYFISVDKTSKWFSVGVDNDASSTKTNVYVVTPLNYTNYNTVVFGIVADKNRIGRFKDDLPNRSFKGISVPLGAKLKIISLSYINGNIYLDSKDVIVTQNITVKLDPKQKTKAEVTAFLNSL
ncbi:MAG: hypothetical protein JWN76_9 [Chitinophagaceae bacterium]|nr:hypothetical protein [Chitinophagaceae bacterium]